MISQRRVNGEIMKLKKEMPLYTKGFYVDENDTHKMFFLVEPNEEPYNGQYILQVKLPLEYPFKAPQIKMLTPNGRFDNTQWICTSFSHFHQETHNCVLSIGTIVSMTIQYMLDESLSGVGVIPHCTKEEKALFAQQSNTNNLDIMRRENIYFQ